MFGENVKKILDLKGISQSQLAEILGVTRQSVSIALKQEKPHQKTVENFAAALDVDSSVLMETESRGLTFELANLDTGIGTEIKSLGDGRFLIITSFVSQKFMRGYISKLADPSYLAILPKYAITYDKVLFGEYRSFEVFETFKSDHFNVVLKPSSVVTCRKWEISEIQNLEIFGSTLCVVVTKNRVLISEFSDYVNETKSIIGLDTTTEISEISILLEEIQEFYEVLSITTKAFS